MPRSPSDKLPLICRTLRERIFDRSLSDHISVAPLVAEFTAPRSAVNAALARLEQEGLTRAELNRGFLVVPATDLANLPCVLSTRLFSQMSAVDSMVRLVKRGDVQRLSTVREQMELLRTSVPEHSSSSLDEKLLVLEHEVAFWASLFERADFGLLANAHTQAVYVFWRVLGREFNNVYSPVKAAEGCNAVLEAIIAEDFPRAVAAVTSITSAIVIGTLQQYGDVITERMPEVVTAFLTAVQPAEVVQL